MAAEPSTYTTRDPAHPSNANQDHTTKDGEKPTNAFTAITDPDFLPTLESAPKTQHLKSYLVLISLVVGGVVGAWFYGFELFQFSSTQDPQIPFQPAEPTVSDSSVLEIISLLGLVVAALLVVISWTGALWIDWWELVLGYWWLSMPVGGAAGLCLVLMQETASGMDEVA
ncbi:hypothetical protein PVAG01_04085 [Phlyctema vagabunda]|uniref:Transmembrane protein n=1 Tax=Phlyctema vagabunda TaxID=108571 RepID=A0ABR4PN97_9HELO